MTTSNRTNLNNGILVTQDIIDQWNKEWHEWMIETYGKEQCDIWQKEAEESWNKLEQKLERKYGDQNDYK